MARHPDLDWTDADARLNLDCIHVLMLLVELRLGLFLE